MYIRSRTKLYQALNSNSLSLAQLLRRYGAEQITYKTLITKAIKQEGIDKIRVLLSYSSDSDVIDESGRHTALLMAAQDRQLELCLEPGGL